METRQWVRSLGIPIIRNPIYVRKWRRRTLRWVSLVKNYIWEDFRKKFEKIVNSVYFFTFSWFWGARRKNAPTKRTQNPPYNQTVSRARRRPAAVSQTFLSLHARDRTVYEIHGRVLLNYTRETAPLTKPRAHQNQRRRRPRSAGAVDACRAASVPDSGWTEGKLVKGRQIRAALSAGKASNSPTGGN